MPKFRLVILLTFLFYYVLLDAAFSKEIYQEIDTLVLKNYKVSIVELPNGKKKVISFFNSEKKSDIFPTYFENNISVSDLKCFYYTPRSIYIFSFVAETSKNRIQYFWNIKKNISFYIKKDKNSGESTISNNIKKFSNMSKIISLHSFYNLDKKKNDMIGIYFYSEAPFTMDLMWDYHLLIYKKDKVYKSMFNTLGYAYVHKVHYKVDNLFELKVNESENLIELYMNKILSVEKTNNVNDDYNKISGKYKRNTHFFSLTKNKLKTIWNEFTPDYDVETDEQLNSKNFVKLMFKSDGRKYQLIAKE